MPKTLLAIDLGAGSGRVMAGQFDGEHLTLHEVHRFANEPLHLPSGLHWDLFGLYRNIVDGLNRAVATCENVCSAGVDTWGVDYVLVTNEGHLSGLPHAYRCARNEGMVARAREKLSAQEIYDHTGLQTLPFNTLYQLLADRAYRPRVLEAAERILLMPDLINFWLTGIMINERTDASTTQLYNPKIGDWDRELIGRMGLPGQIFGEIGDPGNTLGKSIVDDHPFDIVLVGAHDTASAVAGAPLAGPSSAYLSSGTWSLLGLELAEPVITSESREANYTNEVGVFSTIRFLKNLTGMWLVQESKRAWEAAGQAADFAQLAAEAEAAEAFFAYIHPDEERYIAPGDMPGRIRERLSASGQRVPDSRGQLVRVIYESLALAYRQHLETLQPLTGQTIERLNVVGGGSNAALLNQFTANAIQRPVEAGPAEATALGNILVQLIAAGDIKDLAEGRELLRRSFQTKTYEPQESAAWEDAFRRYQAARD